MLSRFRQLQNDASVCDKNNVVLASRQVVYLLHFIATVTCQASHKQINKERRRLQNATLSRPYK
jgi:hypothetical protein